jgi:glycosyltransferase involved in cell wall biosynthesis
MRICHIASTFLPVVGGAELAVHYLAKYQAQSGHDVLVIAPRDKRKTEINTNYNIKRLSLPCINNLAEFYLSRQINRMVREFGADLIHASMVYSAGFLATYTKKKLKLPFVITPQGADIQTMPEIGYGMLLKSKLVPKIKYALNSADVVVAITNTMKQCLYDLKVSGINIIEIPYGVDVPSFEREFSDFELNNLRRKYELDRFDRILIAVGRNHPKKGFDILIKAVRIITDWGFNIGCFIVGKDSELLAPLIESLDLKNRIMLTGQIPTRSSTVFNLEDIPSPELIKLYKISDIFVHPSIIEAITLVTPEAMAAGLSIVTTDSTGVRDVIRDGYSGLLAKPGDPMDFALKIRILLENAELNKLLRLNAKKVLKKYDWRNISKSYLDLYSSININKKINYSIH